MNQFAFNNFKFDENGRKLSKKVENTLEKGDIACYKQFLLLPLCFQNTYIPKVKTKACLEKVKYIYLDFSFKSSHTEKRMLPLGILSLH